MIAILYVLFGLFIFFFPTSISHDHASTTLEVEQITRRNCSEENVSCIDTCDFLCTDSNAKCIGGRCIIPKTKMDCDKDKGGINVLTEKNGILHWTCYCTNPTFYGGPKCNDLAPDVCKNGIFIYKDLHRFTCMCHHPYVTQIVNGKPHCIDISKRWFF